MNNSHVYMTQLSDGSLRNGLINENELKFSLNLNLLFYDSLYISAPALLRNHVFFESIISENKSHSKSTKKLYHDGLIRPVLIEGNSNIIDVCRNVTHAKNVIGFSGNRFGTDIKQLEKHAYEISESKPNYLYSKFLFNRNHYRESFIELLKYQSSFGKINSELVTEIIDLLNTKFDRNNFKVADIYQITKDERYTLFRHEINARAFILMEYLSKPVNVDSFSSISKDIDIIDDYNFINNGRKKELENIDYNFDEPYLIKLPVNRLAELSLEEILLIRELKLFRKMRSNFHNQSEKTSQEEINSLFDETKNELLRIVNHSSKKERASIIQELKTNNSTYYLTNISTEWISTYGVSFGILYAQSKDFIKSALISTIPASIGSIFIAKNCKKSLSNNYNENRSTYSPVGDDEKKVQFDLKTGQMKNEI